MWLLGIVFAFFYVIYLVIVVPAAALAAAVTYGLGVPVTYFIALGRVLVVRPPGLPAPLRQPRLPAGADPENTSLTLGSVIPLSTAAEFGFNLKSKSSAL